MTHVDFVPAVHRFGWRTGIRRLHVRRIFAGLSVVLTSLVLLLIIGEIYERFAGAATLQLSWVDNSTNEDGFNIERSVISGGPYTIVATVGPNATTYNDTNLVDGTTYCYRVNAFNSAGASPYTPEACNTAAAASATFNLTVSSTGTGSGTISSSPPGINCGATCSSSFDSGTVVTLTATPASGSTFAGWSGTGCTTGAVTMSAAASCTATFTATANPTTFTLTVSKIGTITASGTGQGTVVSKPSGINCGTQCSASFQSGTAITLQAILAPGSIFTGWSGDADCSDGSLTMKAAKSCAATFEPVSHSLTISLAGNGTGKVTANVSTIDCGTKCVAQFPKNKTIRLRANPATDSIFTGWSGDADCLNGSISVNGNKACTATFVKRQPSNIGIFRPSTGAWYLVNNDTGIWQGCNVDLCLGTLGQNGDQAISGDWNGSGKTKIGVYDPAQNSWELDDGNGTWESCGSGSCPSFSVPKAAGTDQIAVVGSWNGSGRDFIGVYQLVPGTQAHIASDAGYWYLDTNGNGKWDGCRLDKCFGPFGGPGEVPVVGDWTGNQIDKIGTFDPATGQWHLDLKGNGKWNGCKRDRCLGPFGTTGDIPVVGDWDGTGTSKIGVFRPATGEWFLDLNGNGQWDGTDVDKYVAGFGQAGDLPVVGKW
ncbi:MAG: InlB B-repeat-containing protein [Alphaproteobacteria bacterium]